ncbi:hypothetical protein Pst134EA_009064 [Puccinia striiformis f. sp. tritici]|uniref:hypothetical protein n=1 Tax=Puccinia striiformis f. sp. tritici TaxID=168172 RepID=UPI0020073736|nr:hypothetical protein Pst134EA_009064 [Puccinia striiformis f. sp. tritici]KAH9468525.1 hypothetical protein Pst134EA_009064 [Puccinia striiformis f. sp. tritici]
MIFVSSVPVLVAILVIATVSSVASTTTGCPPSYQPCQGKGKNHCCFIFDCSVYRPYLLLRKSRNAQQFDIGSS